VESPFLGLRQCGGILYFFVFDSFRDGLNAPLQE